MPLLYLASEENSGVPQPAHTNLPRRFSLLSGLQLTGGKHVHVHGAAQNDSI